MRCEVEVRCEVEDSGNKKNKVEGLSSAQNLSHNGALQWVLAEALVRMVIKLVLNNLNKGNVDIRVDVIDRIIALAAVGRILNRVVKGKNQDQD